MNVYNAPCKGCEERYLGCHDRCPKYAEFKKRHEAVKKKWKDYYRPYIGYKSEKTLRKLKGER